MKKKRKKRKEKVILFGEKVFVIWFGLSFLQECIKGNGKIFP